MDRKALKAHVLACLEMEDGAAMEVRLAALSGRRAAGPLIGALCHRESRVFWAAVRGLGAVAEGLFDSDSEGVRWIMRRLIWMLNDESGGMGWGCGEAMGEIMARIPKMAHEYHRILCSYMDPDGNFLENPLLQRGALWGLARLGEASPFFVRDLNGFLDHYLSSEDPAIVAPALLLAGMLNDPAHKESLTRLLSDERRFSLYREGRFVSVVIAELAAKAL
ncbi:HEAT repeat domain-containing protein [Desulfobotulus sp. H1]|uniref:HEAT repeat domain-containing protein n=1 Tax=Desulfobotulus pelophilus TaxID=2823377 RepID=A0ABT3N6U3_9BACT|nr:DVU0298 family protein [Desulfobotulus pelophilus]MCW7753176.1 HEAT repeat domain-containing protein [Desulfobotulus pelophilus]